MEKQIINELRRRDKEERDYQIETIKALLEHFQSNEKLPIVLALATGAGKSLISNVTLNLLHVNDPNTRSIFLPHGTIVLRDQYARNLEDFNPDFSFSTVLDGKQPLGADCIVSIPQALFRRPELEAVYEGKRVILFVDESHQFYRGKMIQDIIRRIKPTHIVLMTATPSPFVLKGYPMIVVPMERLLGKYLGNAAIELVTSDYAYGIPDFTSDGEVRKSVRLDNQQVIDNTLDDILQRVCKRIPFDGNWKEVSHKMHKTMIVCRDQDQARLVKKYFDRHHVASLISTYEDDRDSEAIRVFEETKLFNILIVVYRGILGLDHAPLCNLIDMSGTGNIDRINQMIGRLVRKYVHKKVYFKVVTRGLEEWYKAIMNASLCLMTEEGLRRYNGTNMDEMELPTRDIVVADLVPGKKYANIIIKDRTINSNGEYEYDVEIETADGGVISKNNVSLTETLKMFGIPVEPGDPRGGERIVDKEKWLERRMLQIPLNLVSVDFFIKTYRLAKQQVKEKNIYAITSLGAVKRGLLRLNEWGMSFIEVSERIKQMHAEWKKLIQEQLDKEAA